MQSHVAGILLKLMQAIIQLPKRNRIVHNEQLCRLLYLCRRAAHDHVIALEHGLDNIWTQLALFHVLFQDRKNLIFWQSFTVTSVRAQGADNIGNRQDSVTQ